MYNIGGMIRAKWKIKSVMIPHLVVLNKIGAIIHGLIKFNNKKMY
jgi:hypothetical protein